MKYFGYSKEEKAFVFLYESCDINEAENLFNDRKEAHAKYFGIYTEMQISTFAKLLLEVTFRGVTFLKHASPNYFLGQIADSVWCTQLDNLKFEGQDILDLNPVEAKAVVVYHYTYNGNLRS